MPREGGFAAVKQTRRHPEQPLSDGWSRDPGGVSGDDSVDEDNELARAGDEGELVWLSSGPEAAVDGDEFGVPVEGRRQGSRVEAFAQPLSAAFDMTRSHVPAAVRVVGSHPDEGGRLPACD